MHVRATPSIDAYVESGRSVDRLSPCTDGTLGAVGCPNQPILTLGLLWLQGLLGLLVLVGLPGLLQRLRYDLLSEP